MKNLVTSSDRLSDGIHRQICGCRPCSSSLLSLTRKPATMPVRMSSLSSWTIVVVLSALVFSSQMGVDAKITSIESSPSSSLAIKGQSSSPQSTSLMDRNLSKDDRNSTQYSQSKRPAVVSEVPLRRGESDQRSISSSSSTSRFSDSTGVTGRLFFFKGLKKFMWPVFIGFQLVKTVLLALFLPSILGSLGKIVGKGLSSVSSFGHPPMETPEDLDFKDNHFNSDMMDSLDAAPQNSFEQYSLPQDNPDSMMMMNHPMFDALKKNQQSKDMISRYGPGGQKVTFLRNDDSAGAASQNDFKQFHEMPASSTLLTNYDPFYSPLLSRLDAVFQQMGLGEGDESCREKLVCLMYANPAKYAPYSNLVSAQLSRELNQLRKPTTDNTEILRFFRYMRAAREGQESSECEQYEKCPNLTENTNPAMIKTFNDINKLVLARRFKK